MKAKLLYDATYKIVPSKLVGDRNSPQCHIKEVALIKALTYVGRMLEATGERKCGLRWGALSLFLLSPVPERLGTHGCTCRYFNIRNWKEQKFPLCPSRDAFRKSSSDWGLLPCSLYSIMASFKTENHTAGMELTLRRHFPPILTLLNFSRSLTFVLFQFAQWCLYRCVEIEHTEPGCIWQR